MERPEPDEIRLRLPSDRRGFVSRVCPVCHRSFKVTGRHGEEAPLHLALLQAVPHANADEVASRSRRACPYCGHQAAPDAFLTAEQRVYVQAHGQALAKRVRYEQLRFPHRTLSQNPFLTYLAYAPRFRPPADPVEADDLVTVPLVCCDLEAKLLAHWREAFFCPLCRTRHLTGRR